MAASEALGSAAHKFAGSTGLKEALPTKRRRGVGRRYLLSRLRPEGPEVASTTVQLFEAVSYRT